jgi:gluconate 2-dehydrogenase gamma chain
VASAVLSGDSFAQVRAAGGGAFSEKELKLVAEVADMIIPDTDTPGAKAAGVHDYIHTIVSDWYYPQERNDFMISLKSFDAIAMDIAKKTFMESTQDERVQILTKMDSEKSEEGQKTFFQEFKELTLVGYFTSQIGAEEELRYEAIPGPYQGCVPFEQVGRTWAT